MPRGRPRPVERCLSPAELDAGIAGLEHDPGAGWPPKLDDDRERLRERLRADGPGPPLACAN